MFTCHAPFSVAALASLVSIPWQSFTNANLECYAYGQMFTGVQTRLGKIWQNILPVLPRYLICSTIRWRIILFMQFDQKLKNWGKMFVRFIESVRFTVYPS